MIHLREQYWALEVPDGAIDFTIEDHEVRNLIDERDMKMVEWYEDRPTRPFKIIPYCNWQIICTSNNPTEKEAESIVHVISNGNITGRPQYRRYDRDPVKDTPARSWTRDSRHALETLLTSKGCDINKNWLILKKQ